MTVYFGLIAFIVLLMMIDKNWDTLKHDEKRSNRILLFSFILIYLVCVLRSPSVGRDMPGYQEAYNLTGKVAFDDFNYIYFENGYILFMKVCIKLHLSFQGFLAIAYLIILYPIYLFIKKFSTDKLFSTLIYICYILFEFDLTGLRQAIAISIVLLAFTALLKVHRFPKILYIILVLAAATFHKSAYIALVFLPFAMIRSISWYAANMVALTGISLLFRTYLFSYIKNLFGKDTFSLHAGLHIGGNILFMLAVAISLLFVNRRSNFFNIKNGSDGSSERIAESNTDEFMLKIFMFGIVLAIFFGNETSARSFMFFGQAIEILIPNLSPKFDYESRIIFKCICVLFFVTFFYFNTLKANNFDIVPYSFFWNA